MNIVRKTNTWLIIVSIAFVLPKCSQDRSNYATETSATGKTEDESAEHGTPIKLKDYLTGDWALDSASRQTRDTTTQKISFTREARYTRYAGKRPIDSGAYRTNEEQKILYLESEGKTGTTQWLVTVDDNYKMTLALWDEKKQTKSDIFVYERK